jgi:predicted SAM-dependent methyltransferase
MVKLHIGCGKRDFGTDWFGIDLVRYRHVQWQDVTYLPFNDKCVDIIYSSHLIAYFDREEIIPILKEWKRVLKQGGILRLATPDWDALRKLSNPLLGPLYGKMGTDLIYHKTVYDFNGLAKMLYSLGFINIYRYEHTKTDHAQFDDHSAAYFEGKLISLNVECYA